MPQQQIYPTTPQALSVQLGLFRKPDRWVHRWKVPSTSAPGREYVVAQDAEGAWGCSCRGWIYHRARCCHIRQVAGESRSA